MRKSPFSLVPLYCLLLPKQHVWMDDGEDPDLASLILRPLPAPSSFPAYHHHCCLSGHFLLRFVLWEDASSLSQAVWFREGAGAIPAAELSLVELPSLQLHALIPRTGARDQGVFSWAELLESN